MVESSDSGGWSPWSARQRSMTSKLDQDMSKFLSPRMRFRVRRRDPKLDGWKVKTEGSEVTLPRDVGGGEQVVITLNVDHIVNSVHPDDGSEEVTMTYGCVI